jgi:hypothetical protein
MYTYSRNDGNLEKLQYLFGSFASSRPIRQNSDGQGSYSLGYIEASCLDRIILL